MVELIHPVACGNKQALPKPASSEFDYLKSLVKVHKVFAPDFFNVQPGFTTHPERPLIRAVEHRCDFFNGHKLSIEWGRGDKPFSKRAPRWSGIAPLHFLCPPAPGTAFDKNYPAVNVAEPGEVGGVHD